LVIFAQSKYFVCVVANEECVWEPGNQVAVAFSFAVAHIHILVQAWSSLGKKLLTMDRQSFHWIIKNMYAYLPSVL
jgi:hypothetical protein